MEHHLHSAELFEAVMEHSTDAISVIGTDGLVLYASASTSRVLGYAPEELVGKNSFAWLHPLDRESLGLRKDSGATNGRASQIRARFRQKDGTWRWVETRASNPLPQPHAGAVVITYREISASEQPAATDSALLHFAYAAAHDLTQPLRSISVLSELLIQRKLVDEAGEEIAGLIVATIGNMSRVLDHMLLRATMGTPEALRPVELGVVVGHAVANLREAFTSTGGTIQVESLPTVLGHEWDLLRVFQNLLSNALKYHGAAPPSIYVSSERLGPNWLITVRDNGVGIAQENQLRVFDLFCRLLPDRAPGAGIGLATCKEIVEEMGGTIWVESELGLGSAFRFTALALD